MAYPRAHPPAPRRAPRQLRSQGTVTALLDAAERLLLQRGYVHCTTNRIAQEAGVSIGALYKYFPNKEAVVVAIIDRLLDSWLASLEDALRTVLDTDGASVLGAWLKDTLLAFEGRRPVFRLLVAEYPYFMQVPSWAGFPDRLGQELAQQVADGRRMRDEAAVSSSWADLPASTFWVLGRMLASLLHTHVILSTLAHDEVGEAADQILRLLLDPSSLKD